MLAPTSLIALILASMLACTLLAPWYPLLCDSLVFLCLLSVLISLVFETHVYSMIVMFQHLFFTPTYASSLAHTAPLAWEPPIFPGGIQVLQGLWPSRLLVLQPLTALCCCLALFLVVMYHCAASQAVCALAIKQPQPPQVVLQPLANLIRGWKVIFEACATLLEST